MTKSNEALKWSQLTAGDVIDIVAPGSAIPEDMFDTTLKFLRDSKFLPKYPQDIFEPELFCSNSDENRAKHLITAFHDPKSKAVWCIRNGYGTNRVMPFLSKINRPKKVKLFVGLNDATQLHIYLNQAWLWPTLWAPALDRIANPSTSRQLIMEIGQILAGKIKEVSISGLRPLNPNARFSNVIEAPLIGGRLSSICSSIGTQWQLKPQEYILFLEESSTFGTRIDQMLEQLYQVGLFSSAKAVVFGSFFRCQELDGSSLWPGVLERFSKKCEIPFLFGIPSSNTDKDRPIPLGCTAKLYTGSMSKIVIATNGNTMTEGTINTSLSEIA